MSSNNSEVSFDLFDRVISKVTPELGVGVVIKLAPQDIVEVSFPPPNTARAGWYGKQSLRCHKTVLKPVRSMAPKAKKGLYLIYGFEGE